MEASAAQLWLKQLMLAVDGAAVLIGGGWGGGCLQHQNAGLCGRWHRGSKSVQGCGRWHMGSKECRGVVDGMGAARVCRGCGSRDTYRGTFEFLHQLTILLLQLLIQVLNLLLLGLQLLLQLLTKFTKKINI